MLDFVYRNIEAPNSKLPCTLLSSIYRDMPSIMYFGPGNKSWPADYPKDSNGNLGFYMLPPIKYPDGRFYIWRSIVPKFNNRCLHYSEQMYSMFRMWNAEILTNHITPFNSWINIVTSICIQKRPSWSAFLW